MTPNTLNYNGFTATVNFSREDDCLYGKIDNITDIVMFDGTSVQELKNAFVNAVDDYSKTCNDIGKAPLQPFADAIEKMENYKDEFVNGNKTFKPGDVVYGTWVNHEGKTFFQEGVIISNPVTGLWVESSNGITEVKRFWTLNHPKMPADPPPPPKNKPVA